MTRIPAGSETAAGDRAGRGQSEVVGIVLLIGAVLVGATVVFVLGGMLLDGLQDASEGQLARENAVNAHTNLGQAAATGEARSVPDPDDAVDARVVEGGRLNVSMHGGSGACSESVEEDLGAIEYEAGDRTFVYEGGALWVESPAGLAIERNPPIEHDGEAGTSISVLAVTSTSASGSGELVARPDEAERERISEAIDEMLIRCPAAGHTDLRITVTSPYATVWEQHFEERVNTTANVTVTAGDGWARATIGNATSSVDLGGLTFEDFDAPTELSVGEDFELNATVGNDGLSAEDGTVVLDFGRGSPETTTVGPVAPGSDEEVQLDRPPLPPGLHPYDVELVDAGGDVVATASGSVFVASSGASLDLSTTDSVSGDTASVDVRVENDGDAAWNDTVEFELTTAGGTTVTASESVNVSGYGGAAEVPFEVTGLGDGDHDWEVEAGGESATGTVTVSNGSTGTTRDLQLSLGDYDPVHPADEALDVELDVANVGNATASGTVNLSVGGVDAGDRSVTVDPGDTTTVTLSLSAGQVGSLSAGDYHDLAATLQEGTLTTTVESQVYVTDPGTDLSLDDVTEDVADDEVAINATVSNAGAANGSAPVVLTIRDAAGNELANADRTVDVVRAGGTTETSFRFDPTGLDGTYDYEVAFAGDSETGTFDVDGDGANVGNTSIAGSGDVTVTVLGTEVHGGGQWNPIGVQAHLTNTTGDFTHTFRNDETSLDVSEYGDERNLNTYDTQTATYEYTWSQPLNETGEITVSSSLWDLGGGCTYQPAPNGDDHPTADCFDATETNVDASAGDNPSNVQVLQDGDEIPLIPPVFGSQRTTEEVVEEGAPGSVDDSTDPATLDLDPNEAVFLFELTDGSATWEEALQNDGQAGQDPDYNDAIVIVEFAGGTVDANLVPVVDVSADGNGLTFGTTVGDSGGSTPSAGTGSVDESDGGSGSAPDAPDDDSGSPTPPSEVDVEVDIVTLE